MSRRSKLLIGLAATAAVVVGAGAGLWWWVLRDSAPPPAALPVRAVVSDGSSTIAGSWQVQQGQRVFVGYRMLELFGGDTLKRTTVGRTGAVSGTLVLTKSRVLSATIAADLSQLKSDEARRDRYLKTHAIETAKFPQATFALTAPISVGAPAPGQVLTVTAHGNLTLHGVTRGVLVPLQARWNGTTIDVTGSLTLRLADYQIVPPAIGGFVAVDDTGLLELQLTFARPATGR